MTAAENKNLLDPDVLSQLPNLILQAQTIVSSLSKGQHRSIYHGSSIEFSEHKLYSPGDEPKWIDWKFFAKTDKYYVKQFENESHINVYLLIDSSYSMGYKGLNNKGLSKLNYASMLLASIALLVTKQQDYVGFLSSSETKNSFLPAGRTPDHLSHIVKKLEELQPTKGSSLSSTINLLCEKIRKGGIVIIASDLLDDEKKIGKSLRLLKQKKQKIFLLQTLHTAELTFPFTALMEFFDMEDTQKNKITVEPSRVKEKYLKEMKNYLHWWKEQSLTYGVDHHLVDTSQPLHLPLIKILSSK